MTVVDDKTILEWCFVVGALNLSALGFLYSAYISFMIEDPSQATVSFIKEFCRVLVGTLVVLAGLSVYTAFVSGPGIPAWIIVLCLCTLAIYAVRLAFKMK